MLHLHLTSVKTEKLKCGDYRDNAVVIRESFCWIHWSHVFSICSTFFYRGKKVKRY